MDLIIGASGLVGGALLRKLGQAGIGTYRTRPAKGLRALDAGDRSATRSLLAEIGPSLVYFPAAQPNVDWCEAHPAEARVLNVTPALIAIEETARIGAHLVFFSSDYVFDGSRGPYAESDPPSPLSEYGREKVELEQRVLAAGGTVVRTTTVFGLETPPGKNFVLRLVHRLSALEPVTVPDDQVSTPTWSDELASGAVAVAGQGGVWHVAGPDLLSRLDLARLVATGFGLDAGLIEGVPTTRLDQAAARPLRGGLRIDRLAQHSGRRPVPTALALAALRGQLAA